MFLGVGGSQVDLDQVSWKVQYIWQQTASRFEFGGRDGRPCAGDCLVASSFVSYLGPFNKEFRELLLNRDLSGACQRLGIPTTPNLAPTQFLVDTSEIGEWTLQVRPGVAGAAANAGVSRTAWQAPCKPKAGRGGAVL